MIPTRCAVARTAALLASFAAAAAPAAAQDLPPIPATDTVEVTAAARLDAGGLHRFLFGSGYRDLWTAPIRVPVLDLERFAGGVRATEEGGGMQTKSLRLMSEDGIEYVARSVDKDPSAILPPRIRARSAVRSILLDQVSAAFPASALALPPLVDALGLPRPDPHLVVLPDHERLGEWREEYAGRLMMLEQYPSEAEDDGPGFAGFEEVEGSDDLFERLNESPGHRIDTTGFLAARFLDFIVNDWDRHEDQWRWGARADGKDTLWVPIPRDRDQAFIGFGGLFLDLARLTAPRLVSFDPEPPLRGLTHNSRFLDRRLLAGVERPAFDSVARVVQASLTDELLEEAMRRLPEPYRAAALERVVPVLRIRRDSLPQVAERFYLQLARNVDVHATDEEDLALVDRHEDGSVTVQLLEDPGEDEVEIEELIVEGGEGGKGGKGGKGGRGGNGGGVEGEDAWFRRRFVPEETREVRIYLHGDDDRAVIRGDSRDGSITVRVIGGRGENVFADSARVGAQLYDEGSTALVTYGPDSLVSRHIDRRPWVLPPGELTDPVPPPPDFGGGLAPWGTIGYASGLGFTWGIGGTLTQYGFRKIPFARQIGFTLEQATGPGDLRATASAEFRREASHVGVRFSALASGLEVVRWHGLGNETPRLDEGDDAAEFHRVDHSEYRLAAEVVFPVGRSATGVVGPVLQHSTTDLRDDQLLGTEPPFGSGDFTQLGVRADFDWAGTDGAGVSRRGFAFTGGGAFFPGMLDVEEPFGHLRAEVRRYLPLPLPGDPALALRAGGHRTWGEFPYFAAAFIGGPATLRGYDYQRFAGQAAAWGGADLRIKLFEHGFLLPGDVGILGLADAARVWVEGETDETWHTAFGGGVWFAFIDEAGTVSLTLADGDEGTGVYLSMGFDF